MAQKASKPVNQRETVGVVGTGIMGAPMARNLAKAGFSVIAYNRTRARAEALAADGVRVADSIAQVGREASVVITMVPDTPDVLGVVEGPGGLAESMARGSLLIDMSTISPAETRALATRMAHRGIAMLDAPVSGGSWGAQQGTLAIMVGGSPDAFRRAKPVFEAMGKTITHLGPSGAGQTTKLVNQILVAGTCSAVAEALVFAAANGADLLKTIEAVAGGAAGSWQLSNLGPRMAKGDFAPGFMVRLQQKDLRLVSEAAQEAHVPLLVANVARQYYTALEAGGLGEEGTQAIIKAVEKLAGVEARQRS
jgi:3-hydroxyisobutyrate dehydrogenase